MNGVFDKQTSGNEWIPVVHSMLHEREQDRVAPPPRGQQRIILDDFERQMERHEQEHLLVMEEIARTFVLPRDGSVESFISAHRVLAQFLIQALPHLRGSFGDVVFALRATTDEDGWQQLYVDALWPGDSTEAFLAIDRFQDAWWIANSHLTAGHLTFTYRLV